MIDAPVPTSDLRVSFALAAAALLLYLAFGQNAMHGLDAYHYLRFVHEEQLTNTVNVFYLPLAWLWARLLAVVDVPLYEAMRSLSGVGAAIGAFAVHRAARRLGMPAGPALRAAVAAAVTPAVVDAATVAEIDALLYACAGIAWVPFASLLRGGRWRHAVATGLLTAAAAGFHAAGHLLAVSLCGLCVVWDWPARRLPASLRASLVLISTHAVATLVVGWLAGAAGQAEMTTNTLGLSFDVAFVPHVLLHEWLLPFAPWCLLVVAAAFTRPAHVTATGLSLGMLAYVLLTTVILGLYRPMAGSLPLGDVTERGAFMLGLVPPIAVVSQRLLDRRAGWIAIVVAAVLATAQVRIGDWPADPVGYFAGCADVAAGRSVHVVTADVREWAWLARRDPSLNVTPVTKLLWIAAEVRRAHGLDITPDYYLAWFTVEAQRQQAAGGQLLITGSAIDALRTADDESLRAAWSRLRAAFALEPVSSKGFSAVRLQRR